MTRSMCKLARVLVLACVTVGMTEAALAQASGPVDVVRKLLVDFNGGDLPALQADWTDDIVIIDEFAPHLWQGPGSLTKYLAAFDVFSKAKGRTDSTGDDAFG